MSNNITFYNGRKTKIGGLELLDKIGKNVFSMYKMVSKTPMPKHEFNGLAVKSHLSQILKRHPNSKINISFLYDLRNI